MQMKLVAAKRVYFHDNLHFSHHESLVNREQKQPLEKVLKKFPNIFKIQKKITGNLSKILEKLLVNEFIFNTVAYVLRSSQKDGLWKTSVLKYAVKILDK